MTRVRISIPEDTRNRYSRYDGLEGELTDGGVDLGGSRPVAIPAEFLETFEQDEAPAGVDPDDEDEAVGEQG
jgi:hypothetical protein